MRSKDRRTTNRCLYALIAVLAITQTGCLKLLVGAALCRKWKKGHVRDFAVPLPEVYKAVQDALCDLHFTIDAENAKDGKASLTTKTTDGKKVRISLEAVLSSIPVDGLLTRVKIGVTPPFGDGDIIPPIFEQIALRLSHRAAIAPGPPPS